MKNRVVLMAAAFVLSASFAVAQGGGGQSRANKGKMQDKSEQLNLTSDQKAKLDAINKKYREKRVQLNNERNAEIKKVVTPEQYQMMQQKERPNKGDARMMHKPGDGKQMMKGGGKHMKQNSGIGRYATELGLTADQQSKISAIQAKYDKKRQQLMEKGKSPENAEAMKKLRDQQHSEVNAVLTPEQQKKLDELKKEKPTKTSPHKQKGK